MILPNYIFKKCKRGNKFTKSHEKIKLIHMDDIKIFAKIEKEQQIRKHIVIIYNHDIGMEVGIEKCAMLIKKKGRKGTTEGIKLLNQDSIRTLWKIENYLGRRVDMQLYKETRPNQLSWNTESRHHQANRNKRKTKKRVPQKLRKVSQNQSLQQKSHQRNKQKKTQANEPNDKKIDDYVQSHTLERRHKQYIYVARNKGGRDLPALKIL